MEVSSVKVSPSVDETTDTEDWNTVAKRKGTELEAIGALSSPLSLEETCKSLASEIPSIHITEIAEAISTSICPSNGIPDSSPRGGNGAAEQTFKTSLLGGAGDMSKVWIDSKTPTQAQVATAENMTEDTVTRTLLSVDESSCSNIVAIEFAVLDENEGHAPTDCTTPEGSVASVMFPPSVIESADREESKPEAKTKGTLVAIDANNDSDSSKRTNRHRGRSKVLPASAKFPASEPANSENLIAECTAVGARRAEADAVTPEILIASVNVPPKGNELAGAEDSQAAPKLVVARLVAFEAAHDEAADLKGGNAYKMVLEESAETAPIAPSGVPATKPKTKVAPTNKKNSKRKRDLDAPFHFLMLPSSEQPPASAFNGADSLLLVDPKLRRDYLSRRFRAYNPRRDSSSNMASTTIRYSTDMTLWTGASFLERALIECCELPPLPKHKTGATLDVTGGSLARGFEARFTGIVAEHCHDVKSRALAFAILERSLEQDRREALDEERKMVVETKENTSANGIVETGGIVADAIESIDVSSDDADEDDDWEPNESERSSAKRGWRMRLQTRQRRGRPPKEKKAFIDETKYPSCAKPEPFPADSPSGGDVERNHEPTADRLRTFFAAGGLKILKHWLMDSMRPSLKVAPKLSSAKEPGKSVTTTSTNEPSQFGPMLVPLLCLLTKIPFDKELIVESKINKQIRRLSKQVDVVVSGLKDMHGSEGNAGKYSMPEPATSVDPDGDVGGCVIIEVQHVLNKLKETWEAHALKNPACQQKQHTTIKDPFDSIKRKLRNKLGELNEYASSDGLKPGWLKNVEEAHKQGERKRPRYLVTPRNTAARNKSSPTQTPPDAKESTQQLALREREAERVALKDKLKAAQKERQAYLARLKNQINKRIHSSTVSSRDILARKERKSNCKFVKWKDGLNSDKTRKRDILEEVFLLTAASKPEPAQEEIEPSSLTVSDPRVAEEEPASRNLDLDEHGLFDFDESLLL